jgi:hypothetical protein
VTADELLAKLHTALSDLAEAEARYAAIRAEERKRKPGLPPKVADIAANGRPEMREAMTDWSTAHTRIQSYGAAASALLLAEFLRPQVIEVDTHDWHPATPHVPHDGFSVPRVGRRFQ